MGRAAGFRMGVQGMVVEKHVKLGSQVPLFQFLALFVIPMENSGEPQLLCVLVYTQKYCNI